MASILAEQYTDNSNIRKSLDILAGFGYEPMLMNQDSTDSLRVLAAQNLQAFLGFLTRREYSVTALDRYGLVFHIKQGSFQRFICSTDFNTTECSKLLRDKVFTYLALEKFRNRCAKRRVFCYRSSTTWDASSRSH